MFVESTLRVGSELLKPVKKTSAFVVKLSLKIEFEFIIVEAFFL
jgi:TRAP-type uncharacterized transport system fused permease subunit